MSAIDEIIQGIGASVDKIDEVTSMLSGVDHEADLALDQAISLGHHSAVEAFTQLKAEVEQLLGQVATAADAAKEVLATARGVAETD